MTKKRVGSATATSRELAAWPMRSPMRAPMLSSVAYGRFRWPAIKGSELITAR